jgi:hypothetical protein
LGHNSKAVHWPLQSNPISAFSFQNFSFCLATVPSLAHWEKKWQDNPQRDAQHKLPPVNFRMPMVPAAVLDVNQNPKSRKTGSCRQSR